MPTVRPRYQITETAEVERALDVAEKRWPGEPRSKLLVRLIKAGGSSLEMDFAEEIRAKATAIGATSGKYVDMFPEGYLAELREDWPE